MENCKELRSDIKTASALLELADLFRLHASKDVPQELRDEMTDLANNLCETALYILKKG